LIIIGLIIIIIIIIIIIPVIIIITRVLISCSEQKPLLSCICVHVCHICSYSDLKVNGVLKRKTKINGILSQ